MIDRTSQTAQPQDGEQLLDRVASVYRAGEMGYREQLLATGKLAHEYVLFRLGLGHSRPAAVQSVEGRLSETGGKSVNANRLIAVYHVTTLLGTGVDYSRVPYRTLREFAQLVERHVDTDLWSVRRGLEESAPSLFRECAEAKPVPVDLEGCRAKVQALLADAAETDARRTAEAAMQPHATEATREEAGTAAIRAVAARRKADAASQRARADANEGDDGQEGSRRVGRPRWHEEPAAKPDTQRMATNPVAAAKQATPKDLAHQIASMIGACRDPESTLEALAAALPWSDELISAFAAGLASNPTPHMSDVLLTLSEEAEDLVSALATKRNGVATVA
jgi:hypothetical protein